MPASETYHPSEPTSLQKLASLLMHPTAIGALGLLAINDHVLRRAWPSVVTGKLGDFCWLYFFPALLALVVAFLAPPKHRTRPDRILMASMAITGLLFVSSNTLNPIRLWVQDALSVLTGARLAITRDPTDVIAVVVFLPLWMVWKTINLQRERRSISAAYLVITLGVMLSLANSAAADYGIDCLSSDGEVLQASSSAYGEVYTSRDGGLTWVHCDDCTRTCSPDVESNEPIQHPGDPGVQYRFVAGEYVERSEDSGLTWSKEVQFEGRHEATNALFHLRKSSATAVYSDAPLTGLIEPVSGNAVFAMGHDGVLVHLALADQWEWANVGEYERMASAVPSSRQEAVDLLSGEIRLSGLFGLLTVATIIIVDPGRRSKIIAVGLPWFIFALAWVLSPAVNRAGYLFFPIVLFISAGYVTAALHVLLYSRGQLRPKKLPWLFAMLLGAAIAFLVPYVLWAYAVIPKYSYASPVSLAAGLAVIVIGPRLYPRGFGSD